MSKTDSLLRLLAILRFSVPSNSSRTLNATQAYDVTSSGITLASAIGKLVDKDAAVKAAPSPLAVGVGLSLTGVVIIPKDTAGAGKQAAAGDFGSTATISAVPVAKARQSASHGPTTTITFGGNAGVQLGVVPNISKETNPNTTFYGAITVGTGDYKKWQGNYAVLKINTVTGKGVLRIYDA